MVVPAMRIHARTFLAAVLAAAALSIHAAQPAPPAPPCNTADGYV
jgi:hypothetical protein